MGIGHVKSVISLGLASWPSKIGNLTSSRSPLHYRRDGVDRWDSTGNRPGKVDWHHAHAHHAFPKGPILLPKHFIVGFHGIDVNPDIQTLIRDYYIGYSLDILLIIEGRTHWPLVACPRNVIIMRRNVQSTSSPYEETAHYTYRSFRWEADARTSAEVASDCQRC